LRRREVKAIRHNNRQERSRPNQSRQATGANFRRVQVPTTRNGRIVSAPLSFQVVESTSASGGTARPTGQVLNTVPTALSCDQQFGRTGFLSVASKRHLHQLISSVGLNCFLHRTNPVRDWTVARFISILGRLRLVYLDILRADIWIHGHTSGVCREATLTSGGLKADIAANCLLSHSEGETAGRSLPFMRPRNSNERSLNHG
jgi:hypothetical protein